MKSFTKEFNNISSLKDSHLKYLKFIGLALKLIPSSPEQEKVRTEIHRLADLGYNK